MNKNLFETIRQNCNLWYTRTGKVGYVPTVFCPEWLLNYFDAYMSAYADEIRRLNDKGIYMDVEEDKESKNNYDLCFNYYTDDDPMDNIKASDVIEGFCQ